MFENYKSYFMNHKTSVIISLALVLAIIAACIVLIIMDLSTTELYFSTEKAEHNVGQIYSKLNGFPVVQTFKCERRDLHGFGLNFATYQTKADGTLTFRLTDMTTGELVYDQEIVASTISDNAFREFFFTPVKNCKDHEFKLEIFALNGDKIVVKPTTLWASKSDVYEGELFVNGEKRSYDINLRLFSNKIFGFNDILILTVGISLILFIGFKHYEEMKKELADEGNTPPSNEASARE